jgi:hypothetical protein
MLESISITSFDTAKGEYAYCIRIQPLNLKYHRGARRNASQRAADKDNY